MERGNGGHGCFDLEDIGHFDSCHSCKQGLTTSKINTDKPGHTLFTIREGREAMSVIVFSFRVSILGGIKIYALSTEQYRQRLDK